MWHIFWHSYAANFLTYFMYYPFIHFRAFPEFTVRPVICIYTGNIFELYMSVLCHSSSKKNTFIDDFTWIRMIFSKPNQLSKWLTLCIQKDFILFFLWKIDNWLFCYYIQNSWECNNWTLELDLLNLIT